MAQIGVSTNSNYDEIVLHSDTVCGHVNLDWSIRKLAARNNVCRKAQVGNDKEMAQSERNSHSINRGVGKTKITLRYLYQEIM